MQGFVRLARRDEIAPGELKLIEVEGEQVVLAGLGGDVVAFNNTCTHEE